MPIEKYFNLERRTQKLAACNDGTLCWQVVTQQQAAPTGKTAIIVCDMWDQHWSRGAAARVNALAPRLNAILQAARQAGAWIIHAPSETLEFYAESPARRRMTDLKPARPPRNRRLPDPRLPIDDSDGGSDTGEKPWFRAWTRQHPLIEIDEELDGISDSGAEIYSFLRAYSIEQVLLAGVHTNMCILNRSFGIKQMTRWGVSIALIRDLTDAMYNPALPPYVSHDDGTRLVIEYIEKFWCPTVSSDNLCEVS